MAQSCHALCPETLRTFTKIAQKVSSTGTLHKPLPSFFPTSNVIMNSIWISDIGGSYKMRKYDSLTCTLGDFTAF